MLKGNRTSISETLLVLSAISENQSKFNELALKIAKEVGDKDLEGGAYGGLKIAFENLGDVRKAKDYYEHQLELSKKNWIPRKLRKCL